MKVKKAKNNPRVMSQEEKNTLETSMQTFGDISSFVLNERTGELVGGNHRWDSLIKVFPEDTIEFQPVEGTDLNLIMSNNKFTGFTIRFVDWDESFAKAANIAANSRLMMGHFTKEIDNYLKDIEVDFDMDFMKGLRLDELRIDIKDDKEITMTKKDVDIFDNADHLDDEDFDFDFEEDEKDPQQYKTEKSSSITIELSDSYEKGKLYDDLVEFLHSKEYKFSSIALL